MGSGVRFQDGLLRTEKYGPVSPSHLSLSPSSHSFARSGPSRKAESFKQSHGISELDKTTSVGSSTGSEIKYIVTFKD